MRIELRQAGLDDQRAALLAGEAELGCTVLELPQKLTGFQVCPLPERPLHAWLHTEHPLAARQRLHLKELRTERVVHLARQAEPAFLASCSTAVSRTLDHWRLRQTRWMLAWSWCAVPDVLRCFRLRCRLGRQCVRFRWRLRYPAVRRCYGLRKPRAQCCSATFSCSV